MLKTRRIPAIIATIGFTVLFIFQVLLASGMTLGRAAYGGASDTLSPNLRITSAVSALLFLGAIWTVFTREGVISTGNRGRKISQWSIWVFAVLFSLSVLMNFTSSSPWERFGMAPLAVVLVVCCVVVAIGSKTESEIH